MEITEVRIKLMDDSDDRLQAFCSITFDDSFVVRDLKIIEGTSGPFVAMPSRKLTMHCHQCRAKNHLRSAYCNHCGTRLKDDRSNRDPDGRARLYADIAHPINSQCREMIQTRVIAEFRAELDRAKQPGYTSRYDDDYDGLDVDFPESVEPETTDSNSTTPSPPHLEPQVPDESTRRPLVTETHIEPAAVEPRPPHKSSQPSVPTESQVPERSRPERGDNEFGAGIF